jgi:hypothetical protein
VKETLASGPRLRDDQMPDRVEVRGIGRELEHAQPRLRNTLHSGASMMADAPQSSGSLLATGGIQGVPISDCAI